MASTLQVLPGTDGETTTQGLDNLPARVQEYYKQVLTSFNELLCCCLTALCSTSLKQISLSQNETHLVRAGRSLCKVEGSAEDWQP